MHLDEISVFNYRDYLVLNWETISRLLSEHLGNIIISGHSDATWVQFREPFKTTWWPGIVYC